MKNKIHLTIIMYRPSESDYCMGCYMASSESDHKIRQTDDLKTAATIISRYLVENQAITREYAPWEITILQNGLEDHHKEYDYELKLQIIDRAKEYSSVQMKQQTIDAELKQIKEQERKSRIRTAKERVQLTELLKKYPRYQ